MTMTRPLSRHWREVAAPSRHKPDMVPLNIEETHQHQEMECKIIRIIILHKL